ncbi:MAG: GyrI-like domain-containing protein [Myxococcota bacterium]
MNYLRQIQRGIDYIEAHLDEPIELSDVSKVGGISHWHFQRIFKALTGETLKTYVRSRRLASSLDRLLATDMRILDIAMRAGFESQEAFTRAFKKAFGMTPNEYRRLGDKSLFLRKVQFDEGYIRHINENVSLEPLVYEQPPLMLVGQRTSFYSVDSEKNNIGDRLPKLWAEFIPRLHEIDHAVAGDCYGVVKQTAEDSELLQYHAAIEVRDATRPPKGMERVDVPAATYARFEHRGEAKQIDRTVNYIYSTWLPQSGMRHTYGPDLEVYGDEWHETSPDSVFHYAIPVA